MTETQNRLGPGPAFSYKLRYIVGFWLVEMTISTNQKPTIYRNLYENTAPAAKGSVISTTLKLKACIFTKWHTSIYYLNPKCMICYVTIDL